jgi:hypothetical protein
MSRAFRSILLAIALAAGVAAGAHAEAPPLAALVVKIVAQDGFLDWLVADEVGAGRLPPLAITTTHVREIKGRLAGGEFDLVIAHDHARPPQRLVAAGVLAAGPVVFANPQSLIGPAQAVAALRGVASFDAALARLGADGACWVPNRQDGLSTLQAPLVEGEAKLACVIDDAAASGAAAVALAQTRGAFTLWGFHPFTRLGLADMGAVVIGDPRLLRGLRAWPVAGSKHEAEARALIEVLSSPALQARLAAFRLAGDPVNQAWWPAAAAAAADSRPPTQPQRAAH